MITCERTRRRFLAKTSQRDAANAAECWVWNANVHPNGYGRFSLRGNGDWAHRCAWVIWFDEIPVGAYVRQRCRNKLCVNPAHLYIYQPNLCDSGIERALLAASAAAARAESDGAPRGYHKNTPESFWMELVDMRSDLDCWPWKGGFYPDGYGRVRMGGKPKRAHRVAYELANGPVPKGLLVCHTCDNPKCCNPSHLFAGTRQDNFDDMVRKGRAKLFAANLEAQRVA